MVIVASLAEDDAFAIKHVRLPHAYAPTATAPALERIIAAFFCPSFDSFVYSSAANQLAEFLADRSSSRHVGPVSTLCNCRAYISKFFSVLFNVNLTDSSRVKAVIDGYGKDHPSQPRWSQDQTWDPGCIVSYWAKQPLNDALSTAELALKSWGLFAVAC